MEVFACIDCQLGEHDKCEEKVMPFCGCRREEKHVGPLSKIVKVKPSQEVTDE